MEISLIQSEWRIVQEVGFPSCLYNELNLKCWEAVCHTSTSLGGILALPFPEVLRFLICQLAVDSGTE